MCCGEDAKPAVAAEAAEKKEAAVEPESGDKKQEKRGVFGEAYGYGGIGSDDHSSFGYGGDFHGHDLHGLDDHHHHHYEKTLTVVKNVAVPYPVEKHIHVVCIRTGRKPKMKNKKQQTTNNWWSMLNSNIFLMYIR